MPKSNQKASDSPGSSAAGLQIGSSRFSRWFRLFRPLHARTLQGKKKKPWHILTTEQPFLPLPLFLWLSETLGGFLQRRRSSSVSPELLISCLYFFVWVCLALHLTVALLNKSPQSQIIWDILVFWTACGRKSSTGESVHSPLKAVFCCLLVSELPEIAAQVKMVGWF